MHPEILTEKQFFSDINYSEAIEYLVPAPSKDEIKQFLIDKAIEFAL